MSGKSVRLNAVEFQVLEIEAHKTAVFPMSKNLSGIFSKGWKMAVFDQFGLNMCF